MRRTMAMLAGLALAVAVVTGCGDDGGRLGASPSDAPGGAEREAAGRVAAKVRSDAEGLGAVGEEEALCIGFGLVRELGVERVIDLDLSADGAPRLDRPDAEVAAEAVLECLDVRAMIAAEFVAEGQVSVESADCLAATITDEDVRGLFVGVFMGGEPELSGEMMAKLLTAMGTCLSPEELRRMTR